MKLNSDNANIAENKVLILYILDKLNKINETPILGVSVILFVFI